MKSCSNYVQKESEKNINTPDKDKFWNKPIIAFSVVFISGTKMKFQYSFTHNVWESIKLNHISSPSFRAANVKSLLRNWLGTTDCNLGV